MSTTTSTEQLSKTENETAAAYAAQSATEPLGPFTIERRALRPSDVRIEILYTGVCHSDLHMARNEWGNSTYPIVPGHEIVGRITAVGENVTKFKEGDLAAIGCLVDSCQDCASCADGLEQYCEKGLTLTYNSKEADGALTYGGYSESIVATENFVLHVSEKLDLKATAP
ncbi:MAG: alcohol dehydrogenase catalytic domain-containing protein, partial [Chthoniobacterales bacterium]